MSSPYTGNPAAFVATVDLITDNDSPSAAVFRPPHERQLDNDAYLKAQHDAKATRDLHSDLLGRFAPIVDHLQETAALTFFATYVPAARRTLYSVGNVLKQVYDAGAAQGQQAITASTLKGLANNGTNTVAIQTGNNGARFKADVGIAGTWANSATDLTIGATAVPERLIYDTQNSHFLVCHASSTSVFSSSDGNTWTNNTIPGTSGGRGIAKVPGRIAVGGGSVGSPSFFTASIATGTWSASGGTIPNAASEVSANSEALAAVGSTFLYASEFAGNTVRVHSSPDAGAWTLRATISVPATVASARLRADPYSGVVYLIILTGGDPECLIYASADAGTTWLGPIGHDTATTTATAACAGGRLFLIHVFDSVVTVLRSATQMPAA